MKLGIISPYPPLKGGISKETEIIHYLLKDIYTVKIFSFNKLYPNFLYPENSQYDNSFKSENTNIDYCFNSYNFFHWNKNISQLIDFNCTHLIIRFWSPFFIPLYLYIIKKIKSNNKKIRLYCICDNVLPHERFLFDKPIIKSFLKKFDGYMVMSNDSHNLLVELGYNSKSIIKSFLPIKKAFNNKISQDEALKKLNIKKPKLLLLLFGLIRDYKGLDVILKSLEKINEYDIKLLIAGKCYKNKSNYIKMINNKNLENKIIWHDKYIPDSKVHLYFSAADAIILSHKKISQSGIIPLAYHYNKLIIASNINSFREHIINTKTGYLFSNKDIYSLKDTITNVYNNHDFKSSESYIEQYKLKYSDQKIIKDFALLFQI